MSNAADARRRWFGTFFLFIALGLLIWGQTLLKPHLRGIAFVLYWLACFVFTGLAMIVALLDLRVVRQRARRAQSDLVREALGRLDDGSESKPNAANSSKPDARSDGGNVKT